MAAPIPNKLNGLIKRKLIRELAIGDESQTQLAERYDVTQPAISAFAKRNADQIAAVREKVDDEFAGLLITQKANRLAALESLYDRATTPTPKIAPSGRLVYAPDEDGVEHIVKEVAVDSAARILKQAAEEMGQLPNRISLSGNVDVHTTYTVLGVEPEDLA